MKTKNICTDLPVQTVQGVWWVYCTAVITSVEWWQRLQ